MTRDLVLYRGITPGAIGFDVHGGYGETWTTSISLAACYARGPKGYIVKSVLPASAKRLVLVDTTQDEDGIYDWDGIAALDEIIHLPYIKRTFELYTIYEVWNEEWTVELMEAGYDSIATVGLDGPEEYVLNPSVLINTVVMEKG